jgi:hypothetical protein
VISSLGARVQSEPEHSHEVLCKYYARISVCGIWRYGASSGIRTANAEADLVVHGSTLLLERVQNWKRGGSGHGKPKRSQPPRLPDRVLA